MLEPPNVLCYRGNVMSSMAGALIELMDWVSATWNTPVDPPLPRQRRFLYAFAGTFPWVLFHLNDRSWLNILGSLPVGFADVAFVLFQVALGAWFAWLISYQERKCSPSRFFLEGLLFPGVATALLRGSVSLLN